VESWRGTKPATSVGELIAAAISAEVTGGRWNAYEAKALEVAAQIARNFTPPPAVETVTLAAFKQLQDQIAFVERERDDLLLWQEGARKGAEIARVERQRLRDQLTAAVPPSEHPTVDEGAFCAKFEPCGNCHRCAAPPAPHGDSGLREFILDALDDRQVRNLGHIMDIAQQHARFRDQGDDQRDVAARAAIDWMRCLSASSDPKVCRMEPPTYIAHPEVDA